MRIQLPLALLLASTTVACVDDSTPGTDEVLAALELDNGGLDTSDEAPMFGVDSLFAASEIETDAAEADPMATDPVLADMETAAGADVRDLIVMWGRFPADPAATDGRDWSGELRLSRGAMRIHRRIGFEAATDRVRPRTERDAIQFDSRTRPFADGLALRVVDPTPGIDPLRLRYAGNDGTERDVDLTRLADGPIVVDVGDGNRIVITDRRRNDSCAHGFLRGRWHAIAANASTYHGVVTNAQGEPVGHIRGIAGQRRAGEPVMFGKFINRDGQFVGLVKGTYEQGTFTARWLDRAGDHGVLGGVYFPGPTDRAGGFLGRWAETSCDADPAR